jgi:hypothetical protein
VGHSLRSRAVLESGWPPSYRPRADPRVAQDATRTGRIDKSGRRRLPGHFVRLRPTRSPHTARWDVTLVSRFEADRSAESLIAQKDDVLRIPEPVLRQATNGWLNDACHTAGVIYRESGATDRCRPHLPSRDNAADRSRLHRESGEDSAAARLLGLRVLASRPFVSSPRSPVLQPDSRGRARRSG